MDVDGYIRAWKERWQRQREQDAQRAVRAREVAARLARMLGQRYAVSRVLLTGSLARDEFRGGSDIDLAVEGLAAEHFFRAGADAEREAEGFGVDLVPLESASLEYRNRVAQEGIVLHERAAK